MRGGLRNPPGGRPVGSGIEDEKKRSVKKMYRFTPHEYQRITEAAKLVDEKEAVFVRTAILEKTNKVLSD
jgi:hypothetical protein